MTRLLPNNPADGILFFLIAAFISFILLMLLFRLLDEIPNIRHRLRTRRRG